MTIQGPQLPPTSPLSFPQETPPHPPHLAAAHFAALLGQIPIKTS